MTLVEALERQVVKLERHYSENTSSYPEIVEIVQCRILLEILKLMKEQSK